MQQILMKVLIILQMPGKFEVLAGSDCIRAVHDKSGDSRDEIDQPLGFEAWHQKQCGYIAKVSNGKSMNILLFDGRLHLGANLTKTDTVQELRAQKEALEKKIDKLANDAASEFPAW